MYKSKLLLCIFFLWHVCNAQENFFSKVIIWGHPLHSHTHSYIHGAFYRAFQHLGYEVYWVNEYDEIKDLDLHKALFITEGQVSSGIPLRTDCYYILHNCPLLFPECQHIMLQVYTHDCLPYAIEKLDDFVYCNVGGKIIFMPWATDLLPDEIERMKKERLSYDKQPMVHWVGTIGGNRFGNESELAGFIQACTENDITFKQTINISMEDTVELIKSSYMAPAIQGAWQCENGYIPCRIFKNISYGQWGITNNKTVYDLFKGKVIYNSDTYQLFYDAQEYMQSEEAEQKLYELMDEVKTKHTYINRIDALLTFMKKVLAVEEKK